MFQALSSNYPNTRESTRELQEGLYNCGLSDSRLAGDEDGLTCPLENVLEPFRSRKRRVECAEWTRAISLSNNNLCTSEGITSRLLRAVTPNLRNGYRAIESQWPWRGSHPRFSPE